MDTDRYLQNPRPVRAGLFQDRSDLLDTDRCFILDTSRNDRIINDRYLSTDKDEVTEAGTARQGLADGSETGDVGVSLSEGAGGARERGGASECGKGCEETKVEQHGVGGNEDGVMYAVWWLDQ